MRFIVVVTLSPVTVHCNITLQETGLWLRLDAANDHFCFLMLFRKSLNTKDDKLCSVSV